MASGDAIGGQEPAIDRIVGIVEGIERKIEHLKDTQWELSESEFRYRDLLDAQDESSCAGMRRAG